MRVRTKAWVAAMALAGAALGTPAFAAPGTPPDRPNIVLILTDDQPLGRLGSMPNVRELFLQRGVRFDHAYTPTALCTPSRASLLTGRSAHETRVYDNRGPDGAWSAVNANGLEQTMLPVWLHDAGYHTVLVGKYLNVFGRSDPGYVPPGWDGFDAHLAGGYFYDYTLRLASSGSVRDRTYGSTPSDYSTDVFADLAVSQVTAAPADQPLFLMFTPTAPHGPATPAPRDLGSWDEPVFLGPDVNEADVSDKPAWVQRQSPKSVTGLTAGVVGQYESLMAVDDAVGRIVDALGDRASDTLFVFTSDNGVMVGSHRLTGKGLAYRRSLEVPLILRWDGHLPTGVTAGRLALNVDVTATVLDAADVTQPTDGDSLLRQPKRVGFLVEGVRDRRPDHPAFCGWRTHRWLYVQYTNHLGQELYDYRTDPLELQNLAYDPAYRAQLRQMRAEARAACRPVPPGFTW